MKIIVSINFLLILWQTTGFAFQISEPNAPGNREIPAIDNNSVIWQDNRDGYYNIYYRDINNTDSYCISPAAIDQKNPDIDGDIAVWQEDANIVGYNLVTAVKFDICADANTQSKPAISGNFVVWQEAEDMRIYACNIIDINNIVKFRVSDHNYQQANPDIDNNTVVWDEDNAGNRNIYGKNIQTSQQYSICTIAGEQANPKISGNFVVWMDTTAYDVYTCDLSSPPLTSIAISVSQDISLYPDIDNNIIVWQDNRNGDYNIYYCDLNEPNLPNHQLNSAISSQPGVSSYVVVCTDSPKENIIGQYLPTLDSVTITCPVQSQLILAGKTVDIKWDHSPVGPGFITISYRSDNSENFSDIATTPSDNNSYIWQVPSDIDSNTCSIKIYDAGNEPISDIVYPVTITNCSNNLTADFDGNCKVDLTDFALFVNQWQQCGNPYDSNCI